jgi:tRNA dimethylallyltransferase
MTIDRHWPVLAIFGPTASGKSAVADAITARLPAEIVSADSMQVYRGLPILTNQPELSVRLTAIWPLDETASVGAYARLAHEAVDEILDAGRTPLVVGGTGLYLRAALVDLELPPTPEPGARERFERLYDRIGPDRAHALLAEHDPPAADAVHANDRRRVVRALELAQAGETLVRSRSRLWSEDMRHPTLVFGLDVSRDVLAARIESRTRAMFELGAKAEVARALTQEVSTTARHIIGFDEIATLSEAEAEDAMTRRTLRYAAYQRKWMRRIPGLVLLDADRPPALVAEEVLGVAAARFPLLRQQEGKASGIRKSEADPTGHAI